MDLRDELHVELSIEGWNGDTPVFPGGNFGYVLYTLHGLTSAMQQTADVDEEFRTEMQALVDDQFPDEEDSATIEIADEFLQVVRNHGVVDDYVEDDQYFARGGDYPFDIISIETRNPCDLGIVTIPAFLIVTGIGLKLYSDWRVSVRRGRKTTTTRMNPDGSTTVEEEWWEVSADVESGASGEIAGKTIPGEPLEVGLDEFVEE